MDLRIGLQIPLWIKCMLYFTPFVSWITSCLKEPKERNVAQVSQDKRFMFLSLILLFWWETMKISSKDTQFSFYFKIFSIKCLFIYLTALSLSCSMWDLVPWPGIEPRSPALGAWSLSHWTTMEVPRTRLFYKSHFLLLVGKNLNDNQRNCIWRLGMVNQNARRKFHIAGEHGVPRGWGNIQFDVSKADLLLLLGSILPGPQPPAVFLHHCGPSWLSTQQREWDMPCCQKVQSVCVCACSVMSDSLQASGLDSLPGSSVHGILQARILEWVAISDRYWKSSLSLSCPQQYDSSLWKQQTLPLPRFSSRGTWTSKDVWSISSCPKVPLVSFDHTDGSALRLFCMLLFFFFFPLSCMAWRL